MKFTKVAVLLAVFAIAAVPMFGQTASASTPIKVVRNEWLAISIPTPLPTLTILANNFTSDTQNIPILTSWNLTASHTGGVSVCVSAAGPLAGTGTNVDQIPVSEIYITPNAGSPTALGSGTACGVSGAVQYITYDTSTAAGRKNPTGTTDSVPVEVQLGGAANDVTPDTYSGTLNVTAFVN